MDYGIWLGIWATASTAKRRGRAAGPPSSARWCSPCCAGFSLPYTSAAMRMLPEVWYEFAQSAWQGSGTGRLERGGRALVGTAGRLRGRGRAVRLVSGVAADVG